MIDQELLINLKAFRSIDLNSLITFYAIYQERGVSRAADVLGVTQPAISNALKKLRSRFADPLFIASDSLMRPTPKAHEIAELLMPALIQIHEIAMIPSTSVLPGD